AEAKLRSMTHQGEVGDLLLPLMYLWNGEELVKVKWHLFQTSCRCSGSYFRLPLRETQGNMDVAWGLLAHLKSAFPDATQRNTPLLHSRTSSADTEPGYRSYTRLGYSLHDRLRLELSLLSWLYSIGAIHSTMESYVFIQLSSSEVLCLTG
ncbi:MAG: hypothetical protein ACK56I_08890, partial [bacterium]